MDRQTTLIASALMAGLGVSAAGSHPYRSRQFESDMAAMNPAMFAATRPERQARRTRSYSPPSGSADINRNTGEPHAHSKAKARRLRQMERASQKDASNG